METLAPELLRGILLISVQLCRSNKNALMPLRLVSKRFDLILQEYIFKTLQLEITRFRRSEGTPQVSSMATVGHLCQSLSCDMMAIRDEEEITRLSETFQGLIGRRPEMNVLLNSFRQYCMSDSNFDETDFRRVMAGVLQLTPNMTRFKLHLPFQVIGRASRTGTLLLATTFDCFANRPADFKPIDTLVLDHVSDSNIFDIGQNPIDLRNALQMFKPLKHLVISIKRNDSTNPMMSIFGNRLWFLITEAEHLQSLCISAWNTPKPEHARRIRPGSDRQEWLMQSWPYQKLESTRILKHLRFLELKRIEIEPQDLELLIEQHAASLKELYLNDVCLKILNTTGVTSTVPLWIGQAIPESSPSGTIWLAEKLRNMKELNLDVLRASNLSYSDFSNNEDCEFDLADPLGLNRMFEERFVQAALGHSATPPSSTLDKAAQPNDDSSSLPSYFNLEANTDETSSTELGDDLNTPPLEASTPSRAPSDGFEPQASQMSKLDFDAKAFLRIHNTTSPWKRSMDGFFTNYTEEAVSELRNILNVADRIMMLLNDELDRLHDQTFIPVVGDR